MRIEVIDHATSYPIGEFDMDAVPRKGDLLVFRFQTSQQDRYRVLDVEHEFSVSTVGDIVKDLHTVHTKSIVLVEPAAG